MRKKNQKQKNIYLHREFTREIDASSSFFNLIIFIKKEMGFGRVSSNGWKLGHLGGGKRRRRRRRMRAGRLGSLCEASLLVLRWREGEREGGRALMRGEKGCGVGEKKDWEKLN
jgi:hypothetical protein